MHAFVLGRQNVKENDQIISLFTDELGKIDVLARGIKKITSKNSPSLEPFGVVSIEIAGGKDMPVLTTAHPVTPYAALYESLERMRAGAVVLSLVGTLAPNNQPDKSLWLALESFFSLLNSGHIEQAIAADVGALLILIALGFAPATEHCVACGKKLTEKNVAGFSVADGGAVCGECAAKVQASPVPPTVWKLFNNQTSVLVAADAKVFHGLVYDFLVFHAGKTVPDWALTQ